MPRYEVVLFDADHTLFDFDRAEREALRQTLEEAGLPADGETEARYLSINRALWNRLDRGEVRREWLVVERFAALLRALGRTGDAAALNRAYLDHLGEGSYLLPGAQALCRALAPRCTLAIVTNGVARAQRRRHRLVHKVDLPGARRHDGLHNGVRLDAGDGRRHADRNARLENARATDLIDKPDDQLVRHAVVLDDAVPQRAHQVNVRGCAAHHF